MISRLKNSAGPTSLQAAMIASLRDSPGLQPFQMLVRVLDHDDGGIDHGADGDGDAAQAHDVGVDAERAHGDEGDQHADRQHHDGDQRRAHCSRKTMQTSATIRLSSTSVRFSVSMARWISSERS